VAASPCYACHLPDALGKQANRSALYYDELIGWIERMQPMRLTKALIGICLGIATSSVAHAQVGTILLHVLGSMVQGQIDEWDKANDPNRGLREYNAKDNFIGGRDLYAPGSQPKYEGNYTPGNSSSELYAPQIARPAEQPIVVPPPTE